MTSASERRWPRTGAALAAGLAAIGVAVAFVLVNAGVAQPVFEVPSPAPDLPAPSAATAGASREEPVARTRAPAAVRSLRLRIEERCGRRELSYAGPLRIAAGGIELLATTVVNGLPIALHAPGDAATLRVEAPGFVAGELALDARAGPDVVHKVVLVPDSGLRFHFVCRSGDATIRVRVYGGSVSASCEQSAHSGAAEAVDMAVRGDQALNWCAHWLASGQWCEVRGEEPPLARGEQRRVVVDFAAVRLQKHRVVGPSPELMPHLTLVWKSSDGLIERQAAADGSFERDASVTSPVLVRAAGTLLELREERTADATEWHPRQPMLGVGLVDGAGALVPTVPVHTGGEPLALAARVHVFARDAVPQPLGLAVPGEPPLQFAIDPADARDLVLVTAAQALAPTRLVVEVTGDMPSEALRKALSLGVRAGDARPLTRSAAPRIVFDLARGGDYTLAWQCGASARDVATVHVLPGREQVAKLQWPAAVAWTGEVAGHGELPVERRWHRIGFGERSGATPALPHRIDQSGRFEVVCFADEPPREPATLGWGMVPMAARLVACDGSRHHVVVQPADGLRWVEVDVEAPRPWRLVLFRAGAGGVPNAVHSLSDRRQLPVPVAAATPLLGALLAGDSASVLAWCELRGDVARVAVRAEPSRRIVVRARAPREGRQVFLVGPGGQWDLGHELATTGPLVLEVPATTRGIGLWNDGSPPREIPLGATGAVVID